QWRERLAQMAGGDLELLAIGSPELPPRRPTTAGLQHGDTEKPEPDKDQEQKPDLRHRGTEPAEIKAEQSQSQGQNLNPEVTEKIPGDTEEEIGAAVGSHGQEIVEAIEIPSQPSMRFHGSIPAMVEEVNKLTAEGKRVIFAAPNTGEMERLADIFTEYQV